MQPLLGAILQVKVRSAGIEQQYLRLDCIFGEVNEAGIVHGCRRVDRRQTRLSTGIGGKAEGAAQAKIPGNKKPAV